MEQIKNLDIGGIILYSTWFSAVFIFGTVALISWIRKDENRFEQFGLLFVFSVTGIGLVLIIGFSILVGMGMLAEKIETLFSNRFKEKSNNDTNRV